MAVSKRLRYEVMRRDDHACRYCGAKAPDAKLTVDHVIPLALGGSDKPENLVTACADCNAGKSSSAPDAPIVENVSDDALRWARAMQMTAELAHAKRVALWDDLDNFDTVWIHYFNDEQIVDYEAFRPADWRESLERFLDAGLTLNDLASIADSKLRSNLIESGKVWRYFCGTCWRIIKERQEQARALIDSGEVG